MNEGRLFRSAGATGAQAETAEIALPRSTSAQPAPAADLDDFSHLFTSGDNHEPAGPGASPAAHDGASNPSNASAHREFDSALLAAEVLDSTAGGEPGPAKVSTSATSAQSATPAQPAAATAPAEDSVVSGLAALRAASRAKKQPKIRRASAMTINYRGALVIITAVTLIAGTAEALVTGSIGLLTCILSVLATEACARVVAREDASAVVFALPIAWLLCALIPGQLVAPSAGTFVARQALLILQVLGNNAWWILGGTLVAALLGFAGKPRATTA